MQSNLDFMITEDPKTTIKDRGVSGKDGVALNKDDVSMKKNVYVNDGVVLDKKDVLVEDASTKASINDGVALDKENVSVKETVSVTDGVPVKDDIAIDVSISGKDGVACDVNVSAKDDVVLDKESVILGKDDISVNKDDVSMKKGTSVKKDILQKDNVSSHAKDGVSATKDRFVVTTITPFLFYHEEHKGLDKIFVDFLQEEMKDRVSSKELPKGSCSLLDLLLCLPEDSPLRSPSYNFISPADIADPKLLASKTSIFPRFFRTRLRLYVILQICREASIFSPIFKSQIDSLLTNAQNKIIYLDPNTIPILLTDKENKPVTLNYTNISHAIINNLKLLDTELKALLPILTSILGFPSHYKASLIVNDPHIKRVLLNLAPSHINQRVPDYYYVFRLLSMPEETLSFFDDTQKKQWFSFLPEIHNLLVIIQTEMLNKPLLDLTECWDSIVKTADKSIINVPITVFFSNNILSKNTFSRFVEYMTIFTPLLWLVALHHFKNK